MKKELSFGTIEIGEPPPRELNRLQKKAYILQQYYAEKMQAVSENARDKLMDELASRLVDLDYQTMALFIQELEIPGVGVEKPLLWKYLRDNLATAQAEELAEALLEVKRGNSKIPATLNTSPSRDVSLTDTPISDGGSSTISVSLNSKCSGG